MLSSSKKNCGQPNAYIPLTHSVRKACIAKSARPARRGITRSSGLCFPPAIAPESTRPTAKQTGKLCRGDGGGIVGVGASISSSTGQASTIAGGKEGYPPRSTASLKLHKRKSVLQGSVGEERGEEGIEWPYFLWPRLGVPTSLYDRLTHRTFVWTICFMFQSMSRQLTTVN